MIPTMLILAGMCMLVWSSELDAPSLDEAMAGHVLREAFGEPTYEPLPHEIEQISKHVATKLRIVRNGE